MTTTAIIGGVIALFFITIAIAIVILVVRLISRPIRRIPTPDHSDTATETSLPTPESSRLPYACIPHLLTPAEGDFFAVLQASAPAGMVIFAQVRLANLVEVQPWARRNKTHWYKIQAKCVDFVLCEPHTFITRLVIELDDSSHNRADRRARDAFVDAVLADAGLPILHVRWQSRYDPRDLTQQIAIMLPNTNPTAASWTPLPTPLALPPQPTEASWTPIASAVAPMRHTCGDCQADIRAGAKFCPSCGAVFAFQ